MNPTAEVKSKKHSPFKESRIEIDISYHGQAIGTFYLTSFLHDRKVSGLV